MPSILIRLDAHLLEALDRIAPARKRQRTEFVRQAVKDAIRRREFDQIREAYRLQPDVASDTYDWSNAEAWNS